MKKITSSKPSHKPEQVGTFRFPAGLGLFSIEGQCMEPAFPDGSQVFAVEATSTDIKPGTPVVVLTKYGRRYCKLWNGQCEDGIFLRALNPGPNVLDCLILLHPEVAAIWIVQGVWLNDKPLVKSPA